MTLLDDLQPAVACLQQLLGDWRPEMAIVVGSGLAALTEEMSERQRMAYADLPGFPAAGVVGHAGQLRCGELHGTSVAVFQGRYHYYEGYSAYQVSAPVRLAHLLGCRRLLLTNAAGGINAAYAPGDFMLVSDHLNLAGDNPLRALQPPPFIDLGALYRRDFHAELQADLAPRRIVMHQGTLAWMSGPSYETPAEIRMLAQLGADAVSMSTIPEAIMARYLGLETVAISLIANAAAGLSVVPLCHEEVLATSRTAAASLPLLISRLLPIFNR